MASTTCTECRRRYVSTSAQTFPYCGDTCEDAAAERRARAALPSPNGAPEPGTRPRRTGTLRGF